MLKRLEHVCPVGQLFAPLLAGRILRIFFFFCCLFTAPACAIFLCPYFLWGILCPNRDSLFPLHKTLLLVLEVQPFSLPRMSPPSPPTFFFTMLRELRFSVLPLDSQYFFFLSPFLWFLAFSELLLRHNIFLIFLALSAICIFCFLCGLRCAVYPTSFVFAHHRPPSPLGITLLIFFTSRLAFWFRNN